MTRLWNDFFQKCFYMNILFLCVANSARSQIAEALAKKYLGRKCKIYSAGSRPAKKVHPLVIQVLEENRYF